MKGITPIISIIILLLITIALSGAAYTYLSIYFGSLTQKTLQVTDAYCDSGGSGAVLILSGTGTRDIDIPQAIKKETSLVLYFDFESISGDTVSDESGTGNNGILGFSTSAEPNDPLQISGSDCLAGSCLKFDGNDIVRIPDHPTLNPPSNITVEVWVRPDIAGYGTTDNPGIISKRDDATNFSWGGIWVRNLAGPTFGRLWGRIYNATGFAKNFPENEVLPLDNWSHVAVVYDGSSGVGKQYLNGVVVGTISAGSGSGLMSGTVDLFLGKQFFAPPSNFTGFMDEVAIYNRALSSDEIHEHAQACRGSGSRYSCGELIVSKTSGGTLQPSFDSPTIPPGGSAKFMDTGCASGDICEYRIISGSVGGKTAAVKC
ncbi:MAG: LamG domain-containing protein [Candidatus Aenigmarchaeota archaeon]|nr:LamG domain-containing protein [Candidatus Aenigmarchaeota archaeon]